MKKRLLYLPVFLMTALLGGCSSQITVETYIHEAGEELPVDVKTYAMFEKTEKVAEAVLNMDSVDPNKVGSYEATIKFKNKEYPFIVEVVDTKAPEGTFDSFFAATNKTIHLDSFGLKVNDISEFKVGFRKYELIKKETELAELFQKAMDESEEIQIAEVLNIQWELEKDNWEEKGTSLGSLQEEIIPEKDGLYRMEIVAADMYGNATVMNGYALVDTTAPVISGVEDKKILINKNTKLENVLDDGVSAVDNLLGDITDSVSIKEEMLENLDEEITGFKEKVIYTVADYFGNETVAERTVEAEFDKESIVPEPQQAAVADGFNRAMAEEAFVLVNKERAAVGLHQLAWDDTLYELSCMRAKEIVNKPGHERPDGTYITSLIRSMGYHGGSGENLARYSIDSKEAVNAWMNSPTHKDNILTDFYNFGAIAWYTHNGVNYVVNLFRG